MLAQQGHGFSSDSDTDAGKCACMQVRQHPKLLRQVLALDKLVGATVKALSSAGS